MKYVDEFRDAGLARSLGDAIAQGTGQTGVTE